MQLLLKVILVLDLAQFNLIVTVKAITIITTLYLTDNMSKVLIILSNLIILIITTITQNLL